MRNKLILQVCLPTVGKSFDVRVPGQFKVARAADMLAEYLKRLDEEYVPTAESVLCDLESGRILDPDLPLGAAGLHSGSKIMIL